MDKIGVRTYVSNWIKIWKNNKNPISDTRIRESWACNLWNIRYKNNSNYYTLSYKKKKYILLVYDDYENKNLKIEGILENPNNIYSTEMP